MRKLGTEEEEPSFTTCPQVKLEFQKSRLQNVDNGVYLTSLS